MPHARVGTRDLFYVRRGAGEPLLLIIGMSGTHLSWGEKFVDLLAEGFDVIAYDHRGVGYSLPEQQRFSIADLARDAAQLLDVLGLESAHVHGISMGGMVAQELALRDRERVRTLALGCTTPGGPRSVHTDPAVVQRLAEALLSGDRERSLRVGLEFNVSREYAARPGVWETFRDLALQLPVPVPVIMLQFQAVLAHDTVDRLPSLEVPTLVMHGTEDQLVPFGNGELLAKLIPGARLEVFHGAGHLYWWEHPERAAALVREHAAGGATAEVA